MKAKLSLVVALAIIIACAGVSMAAFDYDSLDFGGRTITFLYWDPANVLDTDVLAEAQQRFNFKFEYKIAGWEEYVEMAMARLLAGDSQYDVWMMTQPHFVQLVGNNAVMPLDDILPADFFDDADPTVVHRVNSLKVKGKTYAFYTWQNVLNDMVFWLFNKDIFEREGLPDPYELYDKGEWTWDTVEQIALQATKDTDNDGEIDLYGIGEMRTLFTLMPNFAKTVELVGDKYVFAFNKPEALAAINLVYRWRTLLKISQGTWDASEFAAGNRAMAGVIGWQFWSLMGTDLNYGVVPLPKGPNATKYVFPIDKVGMFYLPANAKEPEKLVALVKYLSPSADRLQTGMFDEWIPMWVRDEKSAQIMIEGIESWEGEFDLMEGSLSVPLDPVFNGEKSAAAHIDEIYPQIQAQIDELFKQ
ncbi:MAG: extracellular solute-binding protein [Firmicutes bacterium]|nr:extracellular solute-binding protein [Bacillota bacterium]